MENIIYLDNNSTTRVDPRVVEEMLPFFSTFYGNSSSSHLLGAKSSEAVKVSRNSIAELLDADSSDVYFTSGATESINLALKGMAAANPGAHFITCETEHPAVLDTCRILEATGINITYLPVSVEGTLDLELLKSSIRDNTALISIMAVNNETGVMHPIKEIAEIAHASNVLFMTDATQAVGKINMSVKQLDIDILCFSGHKFYGPKGVGGVYLRSRRPFKVRVPALIHGGAQEKNIRSGTLNVPGIVGIGKAAELCINEMDKDRKRIGKMRNKLQGALLKLSSTSLNGSFDNRIYNTTNICFDGADADAMIVGVKNIAVSNGSACSSASVAPSHVLKAMGKTDQQAFSSLRFSLGRFNSDNEIEATIDKVIKTVGDLRQMAI